ncbi:MAG: Kazal-type serine protease inhibitor domain protein [Polyangiaceae bacterium]|jgi:hypothetical protein|nr:Kazal-type serine protease inhibitor domain protein [Polyangiaceae bacterium]
MKTKFLCGLLLLAVGCSGGQTTRGGDGGESATQELKRAAAEARASSPRPPSGDVCASEGWYGDGECDTFCRDADSKDCTPDSDGFVCALFLEEANGLCTRRADDPCIGQDPDCAAVVEPAIECPAIAQAPDGVCKDDPSNVCVYLSDPDCGRSAPGVPTTPTPPIYCAAIAQEADGVCKDDPSNECAIYQDPDCWGAIEPSPAEPVICAAYIELPDGVCKREKSDPCISQDPDCIQK